jgi:hypothetical protein
MLTDVYSSAVRAPGAGPWEPTGEQRLDRKLASLIFDAEVAGSLSAEDAAAIRQQRATDRRQGKKLKVAFGYAIKIGAFSATEAEELHKLLDYRNHLAHRMHMVVSDISRSNYVDDFLDVYPTVYRADALDRLRSYRDTLWERTRGLIHHISMDRLLFEHAESVYEADLKRLERLIERQIDRENRRIAAINAELDLRGTELVGDLDPRFPLNHRPDRSYGDDYIPPTGHLTKRGVEICYRLFDLAKSPIAVAYLMGMTLSAAKNRQRGWMNAGGLNRQRAEVERYDLSSGRRRRVTA